MKISKMPMIFQHPFTMTVSGPTGSGKTWLVNDILQQNKIAPRPDRMLYLYKRWKPLYDEMKETIPKIEFVQGIPSDLDDESSFDAKKITLVILDDVISKAAADTKIVDLFRDGSHHKSIGAINLTQSLFLKTEMQ